MSLASRAGTGKLSHQFTDGKPACGLPVTEPSPPGAFPCPVCAKSEEER